MLCTKRDDGLIYDVGMHEGEDAEFYLKRGYRVVGIEANPLLADRLREKFADEIRNERLILVDRAIARDPGPVVFGINRGLSVWGSIDQDFIDRNAKAGAHSDLVSVEAVRFADIIRAYGIPYYAKIDIEGLDMACVEALHGFCNKPRYLSLESSVTSGPATFEKAFHEIAHLWALGYRWFKYIDQSRLERLNGLFLDREGTPMHYAYNRESSGPFGDEIPGNWQSIEETFKQMRRLIRYQNTMGFGGRSSGYLWSKVAARLRRIVTGRETHSWYDLHARS